MNDDLILTSEAAVRRLLGQRVGAFSVLAPLGAYAGCGALRVLRMRQHGENRVELVCGYERYEPVTFEGQD